MADNSAQTLKDIQKMNNKTTLELQKLANANTAKTFNFNKQEAEKNRLFNSQEATLARQFNSSEARLSRDWQEKMSNTSHQREVADLKKAGLNPVLSVNGGAQSYVTSSANASPASGQNASAQADYGAIGAIAGIRQSENSARSTLYASDQSLKASQAVASAQRYSADRAYQSALASAAAARYSADRHYEATKYSADAQKWISQNQLAGNPFTVADKYFGKNLREAGQFVSDVKSGAVKLFNNQKLNTRELNSVSKVSNALTGSAFGSIASILRKNGFVTNAFTVGLFGYGLVHGVDVSRGLNKYRKSNSAGKYRYTY